MRIDLIMTYKSLTDNLFSEGMHLYFVQDDVLNTLLPLQQLFGVLKLNKKVNMQMSYNVLQ